MVLEIKHLISSFFSISHSVLRLNPKSDLQVKVLKNITYPTKGINGKIRSSVFQVWTTKIMLIDTPNWWEHFKCNRWFTDSCNVEFWSPPLKDAQVDVRIPPSHLDRVKRDLHVQRIPYRTLIPDLQRYCYWW